MLSGTEVVRSPSCLRRRTRNDLSMQNIPMNTTTKTTTGKLLSGLFAKESISGPQVLSVPPRNCIGRTVTFTRCVHHRCAPAYTPTTTTTTRKKRSIANKRILSSNSFAAFAIATIMTSSISSSSMANAFVPAPMRARTRVVQFDPSLMQKASVATDEDNKLFFEKVEFGKMDTICDMTSSVATTAATSSTSSFNYPEEYEYSLRNVLNVAEILYNPSAEEILYKFPKIVGHRGCLYEELENTREGFSRCHDIGCDAVELDVFKVRRSSKNQEDTSLVVFHGGGTDENPGDLLDYCGIDGSILDYNYENQIREKLTFNPDYAEFPCPIEKIRNGEIPTLEEVLADAKRKNNDKLKRYRKMHIKIELKGPDVVEDVLALVDSLGVASMCSYSSFDLQKLMKVRELRPGRDPKTGEYMYKTGALFNNIDGNGKILDDDYSPIHSVSNWNDCDIIDRALAVGASEIHLKYDTCKKPLIDRIHSSGLGSMAWFRGPIGMNEDCSIKYKDVGNEDFAMYEVMLQTGVQQLCVNKPDVLIALRENLFLQQQVQRKQQLVLL